MLTENATLGMTPAISLAHPKPEDYIDLKELNECIGRHEVFESSEKLSHRHEILTNLNKLVKQWIIEYVTRRCNMTKSKAANVGGMIYTFGSYRLGVHCPGADIDALCIAPRNVSREDFFESFANMMRHKEGVTEVRSVQFF